MYTPPAVCRRPRALLALCLLGLSPPMLALEPETEPGGSIPHARQRALLESYVECIRGGALETRGRTAATPASACASERSAYRATLPEERAVQILETIDGGPPASVRR